jgi:MFS transporter, putative metabolite:H+ symporter
VEADIGWRGLRAIGLLPAGLSLLIRAWVPESPHWLIRMMSLAGYWNDRFLCGVSVFYLLIMLQQFFGSGSYSIIGPYMTEIWPSRLRASGMGLAYGAGNLGKFIGPAGLAVIAGSSNFVSPAATADALIPAMNYFAAWYVLALIAVLFIGFETRGRTIDSALTAKDSAAPPIKAPAAP